MTITTDDFAQALFLALQEVRDEDQDRIINNLVEELRLENRLAEFEEIVEKFEELLRIDSEETKVDVKLNRVASANEKIIEELNQKFGPGMQISVDDNIIGGGVFRLDDSQIFDTSLNRRVADLKDDLSK